MNVTRIRKLEFSIFFGLIAAFCLVAGQQLDTLDYLDMFSVTNHQASLVA